MLKLIKTALRSTMTDERLSNLGVLSVESRRAKAINLEYFCQKTQQQANKTVLKHSILPALRLMIPVGIFLLNKTNI